MKKVVLFLQRLFRGAALNSYGGRVDGTVPGTARGEGNRRGRRRTKDDTTRLLTPRGRRIP
jgi:hypothetical protein